MLNGTPIKISRGGEFVLLNEGVYTAEITDVNIMYNVVTSFAPEGKDMLEFRFRVLNDIKMKTVDGKEVSTRGRELRHRMTPSLNEKATMSKLVKAAFGSLPKSTDAFNPDTLVGKQVQVVVIQKPASDGSVWNNIDNYMKVNEELPAWDGEKGGAVEITNSTTSVSDELAKI